MSPEIENLIERRSLRRRLTVWKVLALAAGAALALFLAMQAGGSAGFGHGQHIARVDVTGLITDDRAKLEILKKLKDDKSVAAVLLAVDSPGGTTTGGEAIYGAIEGIAKEKPVVAVMGTLATSAAYMVSLAADRVVARGNTITGSVGVIFQFPEVSGLLDKAGVRMHEIKSGPLKANPSMFQPLDEPGRQLAEEMVRESQVWFLGIVRSRRKLDDGAMSELGTGRIYTGRQALQMNLVDEIGGEAEAIAWLEKEKGTAKDLQVIDWKPADASPLGVLGSLADSLLRLIGLDGAGFPQSRAVEDMLERWTLDGLLSLWHASSN
jgi:protease-4